MSEPRATEVEYIEATFLFRTYRSVPEAQRATEQDIERSFLAPYAKKRMLTVLNRTEQRCLVAIKHNVLNDKWMPCALNAYEGSDRCSKHGGPKAVPGVTKAKQLEKENVELKARLKQFEAAELRLTKKVGK